MADFTDVANLLVNTIDSVVYPNGDTQPSIVGNAVKIYSGWPDPATLDVDLAAGVSHVAVWNMPDEKIISTQPSQWANIIPTPVTLAATVSGDTVALGGTAGINQQVGIVVDGVGYCYALNSTDTLASAAAALAALIVVNRPCTASGDGLTIPNAIYLVARTGAPQGYVQQVAQRDRMFQISVWSNTPTLRDNISIPIDQALSATTRYQLADGTYTNVRYKTSMQRDDLQKDNVYRRDLMYTGDYCVLAYTTAYTILTQVLNVQDFYDTLIVDVVS